MLLLEHITKMKKVSQFFEGHISMYELMGVGSNFHKVNRMIEKELRAAKPNVDWIGQKAFLEDMNGIRYSVEYTEYTKNELYIQMLDALFNI